MSSFLHCGQRRKPVARYDINPPIQKYKERYESIRIYKVYCPHCAQASGYEHLYYWVGVGHNGKQDTAVLVDRDEEARWLSWIEHNAIVRMVDGVLSVCGSIARFPFTFKEKIPVY